MFSGTNIVCVPCVHKCKQFREVVVEFCPKRKSRVTKKLAPVTGSGIAVVAHSKKKESTYTPLQKKLKTQYRASTTPKGLCPVCKENKKSSNHHIKPLTQGGTNNKKNIVALCQRCHDIIETYTDNRQYYSPNLVREVRLQLA